MITQNLYNEALIKPCIEGADVLHIVSGYASATFASLHLDHLLEIQPNIHVSLIVGMCPADGMAMGNPENFKHLIGNNFSCSYAFTRPSVHSKLYLWYTGSDLHRVFVGSANYTYNGFMGVQRELLAEIHDDTVLDYYDSIEKNSIYCDNIEIEQHISIYPDNLYYRSHLHEQTGTPEPIINVDGIKSVTVSLLDQKGQVQQHAGLNWGFRGSNLKRNRNQAYIQLRPAVYRSDFFPEKPRLFMVETDDGKYIMCRRAGKPEAHKPGCHIHSRVNSDIGEYFRGRIGLPSGAFVERKHLDNYGRTDVTFYKLDEENFFMDFSPK